MKPVSHGREISSDRIAMSSIAFNHEVKRFNEEDSILNHKPLARQYQVDLCMFSFKQT